MKKNAYYCEECVEEIAESDVYWENERAYCGQCGSELDLVDEEADLVEAFSSRVLKKPVGTDYDDGDDEEEEDGEDDEFEEEDVV